MFHFFNRVNIVILVTYLLKLEHSNITMEVKTLTVRWSNKQCSIHVNNNIKQCNTWLHTFNQVIYYKPLSSEIDLKVKLALQEIIRFYLTLRV